MFKLLNFIFLLFFTFLNVNCDKFQERICFDTIDTIKSDQKVFDFYYLNFGKYLNSIEIILNEPTSITSQCINDLKTLNNSLKQKEEWPLKVYESNGKPESGFLSLNHKLRNTDLCVFSKLNKFDNQFCLVSLRSNKFFKNVQKKRKYKEIENSVQSLIKDAIDFKFSTVIGTCLPLSCNINNITSIINEKVLKNYELEASALNCTYKNDTTFNIPIFYIAWAIILILLSLSISTMLIRHFL